MIKFRAYNNRENKMLSPKDVENANMALGSHGIVIGVDPDSFRAPNDIRLWNLDWIEPSFSVNKLDSDENEIFQGDILKFSLDPVLADTVSGGESETYFFVSNEPFKTTYINNEFEYDVDIMDSPAVLTVEVIGNIYENKNLVSEIRQLKGLFESEDEGWLSGNVCCDLCSHSWIAVYHEDTEKLECPNCGNMTHFETNTEEL